VKDSRVLVNIQTLAIIRQREILVVLWWRSSLVRIADIGTMMELRQFVYNLPIRQHYAIHLIKASVMDFQKTIFVRMEKGESK
jgi:hypothetical protein